MPKVCRAGHADQMLFARQQLVELSVTPPWPGAQAGLHACLTLQNDSGSPDQDCSSIWRGLVSMFLEQDAVQA